MTAPELLQHEATARHSGQLDAPTRASKRAIDDEPDPRAVHRSLAPLERWSEAGRLGDGTHHACDPTQQPELAGVIGLVEVESKEFGAERPFA